MPIKVGGKSNTHTIDYMKWISEVEFSSDSEVSLLAPSLNNLNKWKPNSYLNVITGINGIGKTQLLNFISSKSKSENIKFVYVDNDFKINIPEKGNLIYTSLNEEFLSKLYKKNGFEELKSKYEFLVQCRKKDEGKYNFERIIQRRHGYPGDFYIPIEIHPSNYEQFLYKIALKLSETNNLTDKEILDQAERETKEMPIYVSSEVTSEKNPLKILSTVFETYNQISQRFSQELAFLSDQEVIGYLEDSIKGDDEIYDKDDQVNRKLFIKSKLEEAWGTSIAPWDEINKLLSKYFPGFSYTISFIQYGIEPENKIRFFNTDNKESFNMISLSSGEQMIISSISWLYYHKGQHYDSFAYGDYRRLRAEQAELLVLDEPDKHLDSQINKIFIKQIINLFINLNIQVIMTTHRIDTIALLKDDTSIFTIKLVKQNDFIKTSSNFKQIVEITKLEAMYRLTGNLREFTGHRFEVCAESTIDADFYSGVYFSLMKISNSIERDYSRYATKDLVDFNVVPKNLYAENLDYESEGIASLFDSDKQLEVHIGRALANYLEQGNELPFSLQQLPIYHDALLYNAAKAKGVQVIGIEGKGLAYSKESPYYHQAREKYMVEQLLAITRSGKNAIFLVGSAHINNLIKLLGSQGFRVDDSSLGQNLITLKPNQAIFTLALSEVNTDLIRIDNVEYRVETNSQSNTENLEHEEVQSYSLFSYMHEFAEQLDLNWQVQKLFHLMDLWKYECLKSKYGITASLDAFRGGNSEFRKSVLLKLHPDKNPGISNSNEDFIFVTNLREELNKPFDAQKIINEKIQTIQPFIYKANIGFKVIDTAVDATRLLYIPSVDNAYKTLMDVAHLYSMYSGINVYSALIAGYDIIYKFCKGEYTQALSQVGTTITYMFVPSIIGSIGIPYIGFGYITGLTIYTGYSSVLNGYSLYDEFTQKDFKLNSTIAYLSFTETLANSPLQKLYDFSLKAKEYEKIAYKIKLEEKGNFGQKLYEYLYVPMIEEKYELQNKVFQGLLTIEEANDLKAKHIKALNYDHCMEVINLKEEESDHYYCYNENQQILDHIVIIGNIYIEKISSLYEII